MRWLVAVAGALSVLLPAGLAHALTPQELCKAGEKQYCPPPPVHHPATTHRVHASQPAAPVAETPQPAALVPEMVVIPTGDQRQLGRRPVLCEVALGQDRPALSPVVGGGVRVREPGGRDDGLLVGQ